MVDYQAVLDFYKRRNVLVTGHTGFKGTWLCRILQIAGANVVGYSLNPSEPSLFSAMGMEKNMGSVIGDVRDYEHLKRVFDQAMPEIVFHLAAQPIVREGYSQPRLTYETNVMGTVNFFECCRLSPSVRSIVNVTTDKVYENKEWPWGYRENEPLDGYDPYSNSKSCSELVAHCYKNSFFTDNRIAVSTARAGNVIGGGDFAKDRILPDCVRAMQQNQIIGVRNANSIRPYQHVLEPLFVYLMIAQRQYLDTTYAGYYNVGPDPCDCVSTADLVNMFCNCWSDGASWENRAEHNAPHEANFLRLDCARLNTVFGWKPRWYIEEAVQKTCEWSKAYLAGKDILSVMDTQIYAFIDM